MIANHRATMAVGILVSLLALAAGAADDKPGEAKSKGELAKLQGAWAGDGRVWLITEKEILEYRLATRSTSKGLIEIDTAKLPNQIDVRFDWTEPLLGIFEIKGDTLRVCVSHNREPRPTAFGSNGKTVALWVLKRSSAVKANAGDVQQTFHDNEARADRRTPTVW